MSAEPVEARLRGGALRQARGHIYCGLTLSQRGSVGVPFDKLGHIYCGLSLPQLDSRNA